MVRGLELFRDRFSAFTDRYVLIGGTACTLNLAEFGVPFRATKDLDIVLCIESIDKEFVQVFWNFVRDGGYQLAESAKGRAQFYRFQKPTNLEFPAMLELFSRVPEMFTLSENAHLTPIPISDDVSSLSAILLDSNYYTWIQTGKLIVDGLPILDAMHLVPLKAKAWLDLSARRAAGATIDRRNIQKHKNDLFRIFQVVDPESVTKVPNLPVHRALLFSWRGGIIATAKGSQWVIKRGAEG